MHELSEEIDRQDVWPKRSLRDLAGIYLRGAAMGSADIVPGVSGGTIAFISGIYEELIDSIRTVGEPHFLRALFRLRIAELFRIVNWKFLLALALGIFSAIFLLAGLLEYFLVHQPVYLWSFFFGLVLASVIVVSRRIKKWNALLVLALALGAIFAFWLVGSLPHQTPDTWWFYVLTGALASCAMILPGISGAYILLLLGKYQSVLSAVNQRDFITLALVTIGAVVGLVTFAQLLHILFKRYHNVTVAVLIGFMLGSLRKIWPWKVDTAWLTDALGTYVLDSAGERIVTGQQNVLPDVSTTAGVISVLLAVALALLGAAVVVLIERVAQRTQAQYEQLNAEPVP